METVPEVEILEPKIPDPRAFRWKRGRLSTGEVAYTTGDVEYLHKVDRSLPRSFKEAGLTCRLPEWSSIKQPLSSMALTKAKTLGPPRKRHSNGLYASFCSKLMNALSGQARAWATCEFFYSDIDRPW